MTGTFILILFYAGFSADSGAALSTTEFSSRETCESAARLVVASVDGRRRDKLTALCVRK